MEFGFTTGGPWDKGLRRADAAGVRLCRLHDVEDTNATVATWEGYVSYAANLNIQLILLFNTGSPDMPVGNIAAIAKRFGPGGTFWASGSGTTGAGKPQLAVRWFEWGNEWSMRYRQSDQSDNWYNASGYQDTARTLARSLKAAQIACQNPSTGNPNVGFIMEGEDGNSGSPNWMNWIFSEVPDLGSRVAGFTIHPYGPPGDGNDPNQRIQRMIDRLNARGLTSMPFFITEDGLSSDDGNNLSDNYGWPTNQTYAQASQAMLDKVHYLMGKSYASRLKAFTLYKAVDDEDPGATTDREAYFGVYKKNETAKTFSGGSWSARATSLALEFPVSGSFTPPPTTPPVAATSLTATVNPTNVTLGWSLPADTNRTGIRIARKPSAWITGEGPSAGTISYTSDSISTGASTGSVVEPLTTPGNYFYRIFTVGPGGTTAGPTATATIGGGGGPPPPVNAALYFDFPLSGSSGAALPAGLSTRKTNTASADPTLDGSNHLTLTTAAPDVNGSWMVVEKVDPIRFDDPDARCILWTLNDTGTGASFLYLSAVPLASPNPMDANADCLRVGVTATLAIVETQIGGVSTVLYSGAAPAQGVYNAFAVQVGATGLKVKINNTYVLGSLAAGAAHGLPFTAQAYVVLESFNNNTGTPHVAKFGRFRMFQSAPSSPHGVSVVPSSVSTIYDGDVAPVDEGIERYLWLAAGLPGASLPTPSTTPDQTGPVLPTGTWNFELFTENQSPFGV